MNAKIKIFVDTATLKSTGASGINIDGCIWVRVDEELLPCRDWFDFPGTILTWWLENTADLATGKAKKADWLFMDGPCFFRLTKVSRDSKRWRLRFFPRGGRNASIDLRLRANAVLHALLKAARSVRSYCLQNGLQHWRELPQLEMGLARIKEILQRNK